LLSQVIVFAFRSKMEELSDLFNEPEDFYLPSPKPTTEKHTLLSGRELSLRLVGHSPLWGHHLWNAGRVIATYLESQASLIQAKTVLELGAGAGLPSLVCAILGAEIVVVTDFPDPDLIENIQYNIEHCLESSKPDEPNDPQRIVRAEGYLWGADPTPLLVHIVPTRTSHSSPVQGRQGFDILILADLLFNHSEHAKLISTVQQTLSRSPSSKAFVFFTPYRPWLLEKDLAFFHLAREAGFRVEKVLEQVVEKVMFEEDRGDEKIRRTVFGYVLTWQ
jgi:EEF1A N-terminal glycine/lysine methyltransferase